MDVLSCLQVGKENRVSSEVIECLTGMSRRAVRTEIKRLREEEGIMILAFPSKKGYWIASESEYDLVICFRSTILSYIKKLLKTVEAIDKWLEKNAPGQLRILPKEKAPVVAATTDKRTQNESTHSISVMEAIVK